MSPIIRLRRNRKHSWLRDLVAETEVSVKDLIYPMFIADGSGIKEPIPSLHSIFIYSIDQLLKEMDKLCRLGIRAVNLFPRVETSLKNDYASEAYNPNNLICRAIREIKKVMKNEIGIICDVALDPYTNHGHDGLLNSNATDVDNDETLKILSKQALSLAESGVDFVSPSDMMDGRVRYIRNDLDRNNFKEVGIISYAAKYASKLYGPFRDAIGSSSSLGRSDKSTYQMDVRNHKEAMREISLDIDESADIILIKPAIHSLDIIFNASKRFDIPIFAYQVSGEYSMLKNYSKEFDISFDEIALESLVCIKRSGAKGIFSYAAVEVANLLNKNS
jgi:porphobilinogen synthase